MMEKLNRRKTVHDLRKPDKYFKHREVDKHPSYGMVNISQISHSGSGVQLFGSGIRHTHFLELEIQHAERIRDAYSEHYFGKNTVIKIALSAAQLTGLMTRTNTSGVPCTIKFTDSEGRIETPPIHNVKKELMQDLESKFKEIAIRVKKLESSIESSIEVDLKGQPKAATKEKIKSEVGRLCNDIGSNLLFLQKCQSEKMEQIGTEIITEAESAMNSMITKAGLEHLQGQIKQIKE